MCGPPEPCVCGPPGVGVWPACVPRPVVDRTLFGAIGGPHHHHIRIASSAGILPSVRCAISALFFFRNSSPRAFLFRIKNKFKFTTYTKHELGQKLHCFLHVKLQHLARSDRVCKITRKKLCNLVPYQPVKNITPQKLHTFLSLRTGLR